jgi:hypothetical protein
VEKKMVREMGGGKQFKGSSYQNLIKLSNEIGNNLPKHSYTMEAVQAGFNPNPIVSKVERELTGYLKDKELQGQELPVQEIIRRIEEYDQMAKQHHEM